MFYILKTLYIAPGPTQQVWGEFLSVGSAPHPSLQCYHPGWLSPLRTTSLAWLGDSGSQA